MAVRKPGKHYFIQVIQVNFTSNKTHRDHVAPGIIRGEGDITFMVSFPKVCNCSLITRHIEGHSVKYLNKYSFKKMWKD